MLNYLIMPCGKNTLIRFVVFASCLIQINECIKNSSVTPVLETDVANIDIAISYYWEHNKKWIGDGFAKKIDGSLYLDPWGNCYVIIKISEKEYKITSPGRDGIESTSDDFKRYMNLPSN